MIGFAAYNLGCGVGMLLGSLLSRHKQAHREAFIDKSINLTVLLMFLAYPMMCARILKLYSCRSFSEHSLLATDWSLRCGGEDVTRYQAAGAVFLILYVFGIPLFFFYVLYITARPKELPDLPPRQLMELERQNARRLSRYTFLFDIYEPGQWWWELTEMCRKLVMTSAVVFIAPGMSSQIFISIFISLGFLLLSTFFNPYEDDRLDMLNFVSQLSTVLTLAMMLGGRTNLDADEFILTSTGFISAVLLICQLAPPLMSLALLSQALRGSTSADRARKRFLMQLPAIVRQEEPASRHTKLMPSLLAALGPSMKLLPLSPAERAEQTIAPQFDKERESVRFSSV